MNRLLIPLGAIGALALGLVIAFVLGAFAGATSPQGEALAASGLAEDVGVHGAWEIDIVDANGTVARHVEFHNDLTASGADVIARALAGEIQIGQWALSLPGTEHLCVKGSGLPQTCVVVEPGSSYLTSLDPAVVFDTLTVERAADTFLLKGSAIAGRDGQIAFVETVVESCEVACGFVDFSEAELSPRVPVVAGQQIQVTVEFSFVTVP